MNGAGHPSAEAGAVSFGGVDPDFFKIPFNETF